MSLILIALALGAASIGLSIYSITLTRRAQRLRAMARREIPGAGAKRRDDVNG